jgi:hypothetical protein
MTTSITPHPTPTPVVSTTPPPTPVPVPSGTMPTGLNSDTRV